MPAPLDQAFGYPNDIQVKKKKKHKKDSIYPHELQALTDSRILPGEPDSFFPVQQFQKSPHQIKEDQLKIKEEELQKKEHMLQQQQLQGQEKEHRKPEKQVYPHRLVISDEEWKEFKQFQEDRYNRALHRPINSVEGFETINDDFNDVLLFGLLGIFFLIFTDYIYKLGRKSY
tara:strand:+ start:3823 stop:4341 length:519 start_codon:yes stop_codon:yes gene_type:complete